MILPIAAVMSASYSRLSQESPRRQRRLHSSGLQSRAIFVRSRLVINLAAVGIHGQWFRIDPARETVMIKLSSQALPVDPVHDQAIVRMLRKVAA